MPPFHSSARNFPSVNTRPFRAIAPVFGHFLLGVASSLDLPLPLFPSALPYPLARAAISYSFIALLPLHPSLSIPSDPSSPALLNKNGW